MATANVYLTFNGNYEEAFNFYKSVFGGEFTYVGKYNQMPPAESTPSLSDEDKDRVMHVGLPISEGTALFGCDNVKENEGQTTFGINWMVSYGIPR